LLFLYINIDIVIARSVSDVAISNDICC